MRLESGMAQTKESAGTCQRNLVFTLQVVMEEGVGGQGALKVSEQRSDAIRAMCLGKWIGK